MPIKFAECECSVEEEEWECVNRTKKTDASGEGSGLLEYRCDTCGERTTITVPFSMQ